MLPTDSRNASGFTCVVNGRSHPSGKGAWNGGGETVHGDEKEVHTNANETDPAPEVTSEQAGQHHCDRDGTDADTDAANRARKEAVPAAAFDAAGREIPSDDSPDKPGDDRPVYGSVMEQEVESNTVASSKQRPSQIVAVCLVKLFK